MSTPQWNGLIKVLEVEHRSADGKLLWRDENLHNLLHTEGEEYVLRTLFINRALPSTYYLGLDNRSSLAAGDDISTASATEPTVNGYVRVPASSTADFTLSINSNGFNQADSPIVTFRATGGSWGPVKNLFLTDDIAVAGLLIASVELSGSITVSDGEVVSMRLGMALKDCV